MLGSLVWAAAAVWLLTFTTSPAVHWVYPDGYVMLLVLAIAVAANGFLFAYAGVLRPAVALGLTFVSLCISVLIVTIFIDAALNLAT